MRQQKQKLRAARDLLLPRLMSGEIVVQRELLRPRETAVAGRTQTV